MAVASDTHGTRVGRDLPLMSNNANSKKLMPSAWLAVVDAMRTACWWLVVPLIFLIQLLVELCGANLTPSLRNDQNAVGTLQFLATFALTQGGALALASQFTNSTRPLVIVYLILAVLTVIGVLLIMRLTEYDPDPAVKRHYFDYFTIAFARWCLGCTILLPVIFLLLVRYGFSPVVRTLYPSGAVIQCDQPASAEQAKPATLFGNMFVDGGQHQQILMDWLGRTALEKKETLYVVRQTEPFSGSYQSFAAELRFGKSSKGQPAHEDLLAFLVHDEPILPGMQSFMRTIEFRNDPKTGDATRIFDVPFPNKGERLVFFILRTTPDLLNDVSIVVH